MLLSNANAERIRGAITVANLSTGTHEVTLSEVQFVIESKDGSSVGVCSSSRASMSVAQASGCCSSLIWT